MARLRVFVSSTYYDLKDIRTSIESMISEMGYDPILAERGSVTYFPGEELDESCYEEVQQCDLMLLIIGARYGSTTSADRDSAQTHPSDKATHAVNSVTSQEFQRAYEAGIPVLVFILRDVYAEYATFLRNKDEPKFQYAHVNSTAVFHLIDKIMNISAGIPCHPFDKFSDIESFTKSQWGGVFRELLQKKRLMREQSEVSARMADLEEITESLRKYVEELLRTSNPTAAKTLIEEERARLDEARAVNYLAREYVVMQLAPFGISIPILLRAIKECGDYLSLRDYLVNVVHGSEKEKIAGMFPTLAFYTAISNTAGFIGMGDGYSRTGLKLARDTAPEFREKLIAEAAG